MANRAYASFWTRDYSEAVMLDRFEQWLSTVPLSNERPGFSSLTIRAVEPSEPPLVEHEFPGRADATAVASFAREHQNPDCSYETVAYWDIWKQSPETGIWRREPLPLLLICHGEAYDNGVAAETGQYQADLGLEHLFTGHGGLLGNRVPKEPADQIEADFLARMGDEQRLREYHEKTRQNIQQLLAWTQAVEGALPVTKTVLWSEGEENLEARLDEILAVH
jgi:hypothetical protein